MSFFTSFCDLPQNEQRNVSSGLRTISAGDSVVSRLTDERERRGTLPKVTPSHFLQQARRACPRARRKKFAPARVPLARLVLQIAARRRRRSRRVAGVRRLKGGAGGRAPTCVTR